MSGLVSGLQNRVRRFESARNLKMPAHAGFFVSSSQDVLLSSFPFVVFIPCLLLFLLSDIVCPIFVKTDKDCRIGNIFV